MKQHLKLTLLLTLLTCVTTTADEPDWRGWRGPNNGQSGDETLPVTWGPEDVVWKTELPGAGQSSPVVVDNRILLTAAEDAGAKRVILCVARDTGRIVWQKTVWTGTPEPSHNMNGWASATCATDGERVYAFFGAGGGLFCCSLDGELIWNQDLGPLTGPWGTAACPVLAGDLVIQNCDADEDAHIVAFDKRTGKRVWKTVRPNARGWSTPILIQAGQRTELVVNGHHGVRAYDPKSGQELWFCQSFSGRGTPTVTPVGDLLHVISGLRGDTYAVRPGGNGNVTATHMTWHLPRNCSRDLPAPIELNGQSLVMDMRRATLTSYNVESGEENWRARVADAASTGQFCATPVAWNNTAFFVSESGTTYAIRANDGLQIVSKNTVNPGSDEIFRSAMTPDNGQILLRSNKVLYCIGN
jgi:outer membrane protein assembly factor BamB